MPTVTRTGTAHCEENWLWLTNPDDNRGAIQQIYENGTATSYPTRPGIAGQNLADRVALLRIKTASIPDTTRLLSCSLTLNYLLEAGAPADPTYVYLCRVADANSAWVEGTALGVPETGASCWNKLAYGGASWAGTAGCGGAGNLWIANSDFDAPSPTGPLDDPTANPPNLNTARVYADGGSVFPFACIWQIPVSWVVGWATGVNGGVLLRQWIQPAPPDSFPGGFASSDNVSAAYRPLWTFVLTGWDESDAGARLAGLEMAHRRRRT